MLALLAALAARAAAAAPGSPAYDDVAPADGSWTPDGDAGGEPEVPFTSEAPSRSRDGSSPSSSPDGTSSSLDGTSLSPDGTSFSPDGPASATARSLPAVRDVIAAAIRAAGLSGDPASGWRTRARLSALVPQLGARIGQDETWRDVADPTLSHVMMFDVRASWRLDALVFSPSELRIASLDVLRRRERRRLSWYVISLYRAWRRTGNDDLAAQLDVVTDGWFSEHVPKPLESHH